MGTTTYIDLMHHIIDALFVYDSRKSGKIKLIPYARNFR